MGKHFQQMNFCLIWLAVSKKNHFEFNDRNSTYINADHPIHKPREPPREANRSMKRNFGFCSFRVMWCLGNLK